jgi:serine/threonine protein kinase
MFAQAKRTTELKDCNFVRTPVDIIDEERTVVYKYMTNTLLHLVDRFSLSLPQRKRILHDILKGLAEMHHKSWVHAGKTG